MDTKKLRQKILDLAIHGKLVPQDPNDEPASVLLERIKAEKEQLVKDGKIKKSKGPASSDKSHYENLPQGWCMTDIGELLTIRDSERIPLSLSVRNKQENKIYDYYGATGVVDKVNGFLFNERLLLIGEDGANLLSRSKDNAFFAEGKYWVNNHAHILDCKEKKVLEYVAFIINSMSLEDYVTGSAQPKLNQDNLVKIRIPLPPLNEQLRIIKEVNLLFSIVEDLDNNTNSLIENIQSAKEYILNLAIKGQLVEQDFEDEPASAFLKKLGISSDNRPYKNLPFDIPKSWTWASLGSISNYGTCISLDVEFLPDDVWILELEDIEKDTARILQQLNKGQRSVKGVRHKFKKGDILYSKLRTYLNKVLVAPEEGYSTTEIIPIAPLEGILPDYLACVLRSKYFLDYTAQCGYGVKMPRLSTADARKALIPIPPQQEQVRILARITELQSAINEIELSLQA